MAEQIMSEVITKAVAEATRVAIQTMAESQAQGMLSTTGSKLGSPTLKQPFQLGSNREIYRMEDIHSRGKKHAVHI